MVHKDAHLTLHAHIHKHEHKHILTTGRHDHDLSSHPLLSPQGMRAIWGCFRIAGRAEKCLLFTHSPPDLRPHSTSLLHYHLPWSLLLLSLPPLPNSVMSLTTKFPSWLSELIEPGFSKRWALSNVLQLSVSSRHDYYSLWSSHTESYTGSPFWTTS